MISGILFSLHPHALNSNRIGFIPEITFIETQQIAFWAALACLETDRGYLGQITGWVSQREIEELVGEIFFFIFHSR